MVQLPDVATRWRVTALTIGALILGTTGADAWMQYRYRVIPNVEYDGMNQNFKTLSTRVGLLQTQVDLLSKAQSDDQKRINAKDAQISRLLGIK